MVRGVWYKVTRPKTIIEDGQKLDAQIDREKKTIKVSSRCRNAYKTYLHELGHAYLWEYGIRQMEADLEEVIVEVFVDFVWQFTFLREVY